MQCAHNPICGAYNWISNSGTCELLPVHGQCEKETQENDDSTFVHLADCREVVPWVVPRRNWSADSVCLKWRRVDAFSGMYSCYEDILISPSDKACASIIPNKGMYLPGWYVNGRPFRTVAEDVKPLQCYGHGAGCLLHVSPDCPTEWVWYNVGERVPTNAEQVSTWKDGTPLYFVTSPDHTGFWHIWYLLPSLSRTFILA